MTVKTQIPPIVRHLRDRDSVTPLKEENSRLKTDVSRLRIEKGQLREENSQLRTENSRLKDELLFTHEELEEAREIADAKDIELAKNNTMYYILQDEHSRIASF
ncbi:MAG: hypothetical protein ABFS56_04820 [Pseudomonadota bacterium]